MTKTTLPKFTSVGCYPLFYISHHDVLCAECAADRGIEAHRATPENGANCAINYEDPDLHCDECSTRIESAYSEDVERADSAADLLHSAWVETPHEAAHEALNGNAVGVQS